MIAKQIIFPSKWKAAMHFVRLVWPRATMCYLVLFAIFSGTRLYGQPWEKEKWKKIGEDNFYNNLPVLLEGKDTLQRKYAAFQNFLNRRGIGEVRLPFSPVFAVKTGYIKYDSMQVWIGQQKPGNGKEYVIIFLNSDVRNEYNNDSATNNYKKASAQAKECTIMVVKDYKNGWSAAYYSVPERGIPKLSSYIQNFEMRLKKLGLQKDFPYTFKVTQIKRVEQIYLFAVSHFYPGMPGAQNKTGSYFLQVPAGGNGQADNYVEMAAIDADLCCQSPPRS